MLTGAIWDPHPSLPGGSARGSWAHCHGGLGEAKQWGRKKGEIPDPSHHPRRCWRKKPHGRRQHTPHRPEPSRCPVPPCCPVGQEQGREGVSEGCCEAAAASACCGAPPAPAPLARLLPPSAEPSTFIFVFPSLIRSTLPLSSNERAELKQTQSVRGGPGRAVWGHCRGITGRRQRFGSQGSLSSHPSLTTAPRAGDLSMERGKHPPQAPIWAQLCCFLPSLAHFLCCLTIFPANYPMVLWA